MPAVGRWVKSVEEYYDTNGVRTARYTNELASYRRAGTEGSSPLAGQPAPAPVPPEGQPSVEQ